MGDHLQLHRPAAIEKIAVPESKTKKALHVHAGAALGKHSSASSHEAPAVCTPRTAPKYHQLPVSPRACLCSPTTHAGSFRCRLHRGIAGGLGGSVSTGLHDMGKQPSM